MACEHYSGTSADECEVCRLKALLKECEELLRIVQYYGITGGGQWETIMGKIKDLLAKLKGVE